MQKNLQKETRGRKARTTERASDLLQDRQKETSIPVLGGPVFHTPA